MAEQWQSNDNSMIEGKRRSCGGRSWRVLATNVSQPADCVIHVIHLLHTPYKYECSYSIILLVF